MSLTSSIFACLKNISRFPFSSRAISKAVCKVSTASFFFLSFFSFLRHSRWQFSLHSSYFSLQKELENVSKYFTQPKKNPIQYSFYSQLPESITISPYFVIPFLMVIFLFSMASSEAANNLKCVMSVDIRPDTRNGDRWRKYQENTVPSFFTLFTYLVLNIFPRRY